MALTQQQIKELKMQLSKQIQHLPDEQKKQAKKQIDEMSPETLETMVKQQQSSAGKEGDKPQKGIFRMIVDGDVPSRKIEENREAIAVVSVRPVSKGHTLIIPRKPVGDAKLLSNSAFVLAKKISKKMSAKLKANYVEIQTSGAFGEVIINVIPVYSSEVNISSQTYEASDEEMDEVFQKLRTIKKPQIVKIKQKKNLQEKVSQLKRRIP